MRAHRLLNDMVHGVFAVLFGDGGESHLREVEHDNDESDHVHHELKGEGMFVSLRFENGAECDCNLP